MFHTCLICSLKEITVQMKGVQCVKAPVNTELLEMLGQLGNKVSSTLANPKSCNEHVLTTDSERQIIILLSSN